MRLIDADALIKAIIQMPTDGIVFDCIHDAPTISAEPTQTNDANVLNALDCVDTISRQAAIDAIHCDITITGRQNAELVSTTISAFVDRIKALPPAEPRRRRGEWIKHDNSCECPLCHTEWSYFDNESEWFKYCPNCGVRMMEGEE